MWASGFTLSSSAVISWEIRSSASGVWPSKRSTTTGVVLDERISPKPSGQSTRSPSMVDTWAGAANCARASSWRTTWAGSPSAQATLSSGVEKLVGKASSTALASGLRLTISSRRQPA